MELDCLCMLNIYIHEFTNMIERIFIDFYYLTSSSLGYLSLSHYPQINVTMENHHFSWVNPLFLWPFWEFS